MQCIYVLYVLLRIFRMHSSPVDRYNGHVCVPCEVGIEFLYVI